MSAAAALAEPTPSPDPLEDQDGVLIPHRFLRIFAVLRALLGFGQQRMAHLEQSYELTAAITRAFGTTDWDKIRWDVTWGLMLLEALTDWVKERVAKLRDGVDIEAQELSPPPPRRSRRKAARPQATDMQHDAAQPDSSQQDGAQQEDDGFRITDDVIAWMRFNAEWRVRHQSIGQTIADVCLCLGVLPADLGEDLWRDVRSVIEAEGGSLGALRDHMTQCWRSIEGTVPPDFGACFTLDPPATGPPFV